MMGVVCVDVVTAAEGAFLSCLIVLMPRNPPTMTTSGSIRSSIISIE